MNGTFLLARRHLWHHRWRSGVLVACLTLTTLLPVGLRFFLSGFETRLTVRAEATRLVVGAAGSEFDLALHALYFRGQPSRETTMGEVNRISEGGLAQAIPMLVRFKAEGASVVGTTPDYLKYRDLTVAKGRSWNRLGDCQVGAAVAERLNLKPGDRLMTEPEDVFDLEGSVPLSMRVAGILAESGSPDDDAILVDFETAWIIAGIGHGHASSKKRADSAGGTDDAPPEEAGTAAHDTSLIEFTEITEENESSFHFHGDQNSFPVSAILTFPRDEESETLMLGRYLADDDPAQAIRPVEVVGELLDIVMRIRQFFEFVFAAMVGVTAMLLGLFVVLTVQLRKREFATMFRIGCGRFVILRLVGTELLILFAISGLATALVILGLAVAMPGFSFPT
ncbi:MAG: ABC transporter permease [Planctomycetales bacterium]|jgi:putative ABC transport system permease protein